MMMYVEHVVKYQDEIVKGLEEVDIDPNPYTWYKTYFEENKHIIDEYPEYFIWF